MNTHKDLLIFVVFLFGVGCANTQVMVESNPSNKRSESQKEYHQKANQKSETCWNDAGCGSSEPFCAEFDRHGQQAWDYKNSNAYHPWDRICVSECQSDLPCPKGFRCSGKQWFYQELVNAEGIRKMEKHERLICAPIPNYGNVPMGGSCKDDTDCMKDAPFCAIGHCTRRCPDCPPGFECKSMQSLRLNKITSIALCTPTEGEYLDTVTCQKLLPGKIRDKYLPGYVMTSAPKILDEMVTCKISTDKKPKGFESWPVEMELVTRVSFICDQSIVSQDSSTDASVSYGKKVPDLGKKAFSSADDKIIFWDADTNCYVDILWSGETTDLLPFAKELERHINLTNTSDIR